MGGRLQDLPSQPQIGHAARVVLRNGNMPGMCGACEWQGMHGVQHAGGVGFGRAVVHLASD